MKGLLFTPDGSCTVKDFSPPLFISVGKAVGGHFEIVHPIGLPRPYVFLCNEDFLALDLPVNPVGCELYGTAVHGHPIQGNIVILREDRFDLRGLDGFDFLRLREVLPYLPVYGREE